MDIRVGPSFAWSLLIAIAAAFVLGDVAPVDPPDRQAPKASPDGPTAQGSPKIEARPEPDPGPKKVPAARQDPAPKVEPSPKAEPPKVDRRAPAPIPIPIPKPIPPRVDPSPPTKEPPPVSKSEPIKPAAAFATVEPGESLADVARRVYRADSGAVVRALWLANRDQLKTMDERPVAGMVLRTP